MQKTWDEWSAAKEAEDAAPPKDSRLEWEQRTAGGTKTTIPHGATTGQEMDLTDLDPGSPTSASASMDADIDSPLLNERKGKAKMHRKGSWFGRKVPTLVHRGGIKSACLVCTTRPPTRAERVSE